MFDFITKERSGYIFGHLGRYKAWEIEIGKFQEWSWFDVMLKWTRHCDHAGLDLYFEILGFWINFHIYDGRHWKYDDNRYYVEGEELKEMEGEILSDYKKIKDGTFYFSGVTKFKDDETLSWEDRFKNLEEYHLQESRYYIKAIVSIYRDFEDYIDLENK